MSGPSFPTSSSSPSFSTPSSSYAMSADTAPITPARFAAAIADLPPSTLRLKLLEIRNSMARLEYSNEQLRPFVEGTAASGGDGSACNDPDPVCAEAIRENEAVLERMAERLALIQLEVTEKRGMGWEAFDDMDIERLVDEQTIRLKDEDRAVEAADEKQVEATTNGSLDKWSNGEAAAPPGATSLHPAWLDGTIQTGTIRNGEIHFGKSAPSLSDTKDQDSVATAVASAPSVPLTSGRLSDEQLRRAMEQRMQQLMSDDETGLHL